MVRCQNVKRAESTAVQCQLVPVGEMTESRPRPRPKELQDTWYVQMAVRVRESRLAAKK